MSQIPLQNHQLIYIFPKSEHPPPITWGQVKATTYQAQQQLNQAFLPQTPENLVAAVFSIITANSVAILFVFSLS
uniref:Uncharacterized protein n=1 Tax=Naja naja TaxID=35670 RepID=A0A8C6YBN9_NAJNA